MLPPDITPRRGHLEFAATRDAQACWLLSQHPMTAAMLASLRLFPSRKKARKRLARLVERKRIVLVGTVCQRGRRPEHVYCCWCPNHHQLLHEIELTELCLRLDADQILRGPHVRNTSIRPDAEVWIRSRLHYLELDRGTMGGAQIARRLRLYEGCQHLVLWVCSTQQRMEGLRSRAENVRSVALFSTFAQVLASPHGPIWIDYQGGRAALPRASAERPPGTGPASSDPTRPGSSDPSIAGA